LKFSWRALQPYSCDIEDMEKNNGVVNLIGVV